MILFYSCSNSPLQTAQNDLLEYELEKSKSIFIAQKNGDPKAHHPSWDKLQEFDALFENLIAHAETETDVSIVLTRLNECKEAANSVNWLDSELQSEVVSDLNYIIENISLFESVTLKQRLQLIQLIYWNSFSSSCQHYQYSVDTVGAYVVNREGVRGRPFTTPIVGIAYYTAENFRVITGDSVNSSGHLVGNVHELSYNDDHIPVYTDSVATPGLHKVSAQLLAMTLRGEIDTIRFHFEYLIR